MSVEDIGHILDISEATLYRRFRDDPRVLRAYQKGRAVAKREVAGKLFRCAVTGNMTAAIFYLKTQAGWKETQRVEGEVSVDTRPDPADAMLALRQALVDELERLGPQAFTAELERLLKEEGPGDCGVWTN